MNIPNAVRAFKPSISVQTSLASFAVAGVVLVGTGIGLVSVPAALIVLGCLLIAVAAAVAYLVGSSS